MAAKPQVSRKNALVTGLLALCLGAWLATTPRLHGGAPVQTSLAAAQGPLRHLGGGKDVVFQLEGHDEEFRLSRIAASPSRVRRELRESRGEALRVLYDTAGFRPLFVLPEQHWVYGISIGSRPIVSWNEANSAYRSNGRLGVWVGCAGALGGVYLLFYAGRGHRSSPRPASAKTGEPTGRAG